MGDSSIGHKQGICEKYFGEDWAPPEFKLGATSRNTLDAILRHKRGQKLARNELPEAMYVFSENHWRQVGDLFFAGGFYAVKGKLAEIFKRYDFGESELIEFPIYQADRATPLAGPFYLLNFGSQKRSFVPKQSQGVHYFLTDKTSGEEIWADNMGLKDGDIVVTPATLEGSDLWFEPQLKEIMFMSGRLHDAILDAKIKIDFRFSRARIIGRDTEFRS
jgi:hypothetical protein